MKVHLARQAVNRPIRWIAHASHSGVAGLVFCRESFFRYNGRPQDILAIQDHLLSNRLLGSEEKEER